MKVTRHRSPRLTALGALFSSALLGNAARATDDSGTAPGTAVVAVAAPAPSDAVEWTLSAAAGPVIVVLAQPAASPWPPAFGAGAVAWQAEVQRRSRDQPFLVGAAVEGTHDDQTGGQQLLGARAFAGTIWRHRHWSLETTFGLGIEAAQVFQANLTYQLGVYAQGTLAAAVPISGSLEALLGLGVHLTPTHDEDWFAAGTIGVRYRLP